MNSSEERLSALVILLRLVICACYVQKDLGLCVVVRPFQTIAIHFHRKRKLALSKVGVP